MPYTNSFRLTSEAIKDIESIRNYIAMDKPRAAEQFTARLLEVCRKLTQNPSMGRNRGVIAPRLRSFAVARYAVYYRELDAHAIEIVRVLHAARDVEAAFDDE